MGAHEENINPSGGGGAEVGGATRPHGIVLAAKDTLPPPDPGLQAERTSLSWVRLWTATAIALAVMARLTLMLSPWLTAVFAVLVVIPMGGLALFEQGHIARIRWFRHTEFNISGSGKPELLEGHIRYRWVPLAAMTTLCVVLSLLALVLLVLLYVL